MRPFIGIAVLVLALAGPVLTAACRSEDDPELPRAGNRISAPGEADVDLVMWRGVAGNPPVFDLVVSKADGSELGPIAGMSTPDPVRPRLFDEPAWSPDGNAVAFTVDRSEPYGEGGFPKTDIYVGRSDGTGLRRLTRDRLSASPVWSPDGRMIIYARRSEVEGPTSLEEFRRMSVTLWTMTAEGEQQRPVFEPVEGRIEAPGGWSPDGSRFLFTRGSVALPGEGGRITRRSEIYVVNADGSGLTKIADQGTDPAWSPDGSRIVFASDRDRNGELSYGDTVQYANELYIMDADGSNQRRLTTTKDLNEASPAWSPDGSVIAYQRGEVVDNAQGTGVFLIKADGSCSTPIAFDEQLDVWYANPAWHPGAAGPSPQSLGC
jgi:Tol biopolymer transport system component